MASVDPSIQAHRDWLGQIQPFGLVVSPAALVRAGVHPDRQEGIIKSAPLSELMDDSGERLTDLPRLLVDVLGWRDADIVGLPRGPALPADLCVTLPEFGDLLAPTFGGPDPENPGGWLMLIAEVDCGADLDEPPKTEKADRRWHASPQARLERLLRGLEVPVGLLFNGTSLRLVFAPRGESSGHLTFTFKYLLETAGRPMLAALVMLLSAERVFDTLPPHQRLRAALRESRKYQNEVSTELAEQVLEALWELLRGFQAANTATKGVLLRDVLREERDSVYGGLLTTLMRLVFLLFAEHNGLLPRTPLFVANYSVTGLFERLRADEAQFPDTIDLRYGAWAQLLTVFRLLHDGGSHGDLHLPSRHGQLFNPDAFPFLEGRPHRTARVMGDVIDPPRISDGVVFRVLRNLLVLDGERLSYRTLDVEQIGSVYEAMMGFSLNVAMGPSLALRPKQVVVNLEELLEQPAEKRAAWIKARAELKIDKDAVLREAKTVDQVHAALSSRISRHTPNLLNAGALFLQPTEERRRSGSHYTPRSLTEPIVATTFRPIFEAMGDRPTPEQILALTVCDPAMGSGAFLVAACRFLAEKLVTAWEVHGAAPKDIPPDEDLILHARRLVAQRCLYGVDKNRFAVDLAKLSLWLATLARDHPFTFVDHALRHGDSLVGLSRERIAGLHWERRDQLELARTFVDAKIAEAQALREGIQALANSDDTREKERLFREANEALDDVRSIGDVVIAAYFEEGKPGDRERRRTAHVGDIDLWLRGQKDRKTLGAVAATLRDGPRPVPPFHWEIEFPEVFERENSGFDAIVGNPPFMGGSKVSTSMSRNYATFLASAFKDSRGKSDLVAYFFRRAFDVIRTGGAMGLVATNTIRQGDTRFSGLRWIRVHGGRIYSVTRRLKWPGAAAVVVSVVHVAKCDSPVPSVLDGAKVPTITAYLLSFGPDEDPGRLNANVEIAYSGINPNGKGFILTPQEVEVLQQDDSHSAEKILPYLGSVEMNESANASATRSIICFDDCQEDAVRAYPALYRRLYDSVRVQRKTSKEKRLRERWWLFSRPAGDLTKALKAMNRVLVSGRVATHHTFTFQPTRMVFSDAVTVFLVESQAGFAVLQSQIHELWAGFQGSSFKDDPRYIPEDCFETFPLPQNWKSSAVLEAVGKAYSEFRTTVMVRNNEGLTKTYNRFHDANEEAPEILELRERHAAMDRAVLDAYGWRDIKTNCEFLLEYEIDEEEWGGKKKPYRYRWPDDVRDEVLGRLLALNEQRAKEEVLSGLGAAGEKRPPKRGKPTNAVPATKPLLGL